MATAPSRSQSEGDANDAIEKLQAAVTNLTAAHETLATECAENRHRLAAMGTRELLYVTACVEFHRRLRVMETRADARAPLRHAAEPDTCGPMAPANVPPAISEVARRDAEAQCIAWLNRNGQLLERADTLFYSSQDLMTQYTIVLMGDLSADKYSLKDIATEILQYVRALISDTAVAKGAASYTLKARVTEVLRYARRCRLEMFLDADAFGACETAWVKAEWALLR